MPSHFDEVIVKSFVIDINSSIDVALVMAIDNGSTLGALHPPTHKNKFKELETDRLSNALYSEGANIPEPERFVAPDVDFSIRDLFALEGCPALYVGLQNDYIHRRNEVWSKELQEVEAKHTGAMLKEFVVDWKALPAFETKADELKFVFERLYDRYVAYMSLTSTDNPVPAASIWVPPSFSEAWPSKAAVMAYEIELVARYPLYMRFIEGFCRWEHVTERMRWAFESSQRVRAATPLRATIGSGVTKAVKAVRKVAGLAIISYGTEWMPVDETMFEGEVHAMRRALSMPGVAAALSKEAAAAIEGYFAAVTVELRYRGKADVPHERTQRNIKRGEAPVLRYSHPLLTEEVMAAVHCKKGSNFVSSRAVLFSCFLHMHNVSSEHWPSGKMFPRPLRP